MRNNFDVAIVGTVDNHSRLKNQTTENVNNVIAKRESIIRKFAIESPREDLKLAVIKAKERILRVHEQAGIILHESDIPELIFIDEKNRRLLNAELLENGGSANQDQGGSASIFNGVSIMYLNDEISQLDQASIIHHEMLHSVGVQVIAANEETATYGRQGYEVFGFDSPNKPWVLEEGVVMHESADFIEEISNGSAYKDEVSLRILKIENWKKRGDIVDGKIILDSGMQVEPKYFWLMPEGNDLENAAFGLPENSGLAGSLFDLITSKFMDDDKNKFIKLVYAARKNLTLIPELAKQIDSHCGKGTYVKLLQCPRTENAVWELIQQLSGSVKE